MILVLAGTADGREIVRRLAAGGNPVIATAVSEYGGELLRECPGARVLTGALDEKSLVQVLKDNRVTTLIDATHPYAEMISRLAEEACGSLGVRCFRYERPATEVLAVDFSGHPLVHRAANYTEAAEKAAEIVQKVAEAAKKEAETAPDAAASGKAVFLTIGSKNLRPFVEAAQEKGIRVVARVLPDPGVLADCLGLGLKPQDIIACQGPFGEEVNRAMLQHYGAGVLVTKDSGTVGGTEAKVNAALNLHIPVVLVERPLERAVAATVDTDTVTGDLKKRVVSDIDQLIRMVLTK